MLKIYKTNITEKDRAVFYEIFLAYYKYKLVIKEFLFNELYYLIDLHF